MSYKVIKNAPKEKIIGHLIMLDALKKYAGKNVFITGHTGFKGSWLSSLLIMLGANVTGYSLRGAPKNISRSNFCDLKLENIVTHYDGDIRDGKKLAEVIKDSKPDYVFHLAAQALVGQSYSDPVETFETNIMGTVNLLQAVMQTSTIKSLICVTSDKCYENKEWVWGYRESDTLGGYDPYSASKAGAEIVFSAYWRSFLSNTKRIGAATVRAGNVIGGGDWSVDRIVPDCIRAIEQNKPITLRNSKAIRPWQHVLESLSGYVLLAANLYDKPDEFSGAWNFGPSIINVKTVGELAESIFKCFGKDNNIIKKENLKLHETQLLQLNCDKAKQMLGWNPRWDNDKTIRITADWYKRVIKGEDASHVTKQQLLNYFPELKIIKEAE